VSADFNEDGWIDLAIANHKVDGDHLGWSAVWWNGPDGFDENRVTRLPTCGPHGMTAVGPGNQRDRGPEEYYISAPFELPGGARATRIDWDAEVPGKTWVRAQIRSAATEEELDGAGWTAPDSGDGWYENGDDVGGHGSDGRWTQYRLALGAVNGVASPRITEVRVHYE